MNWDEIISEPSYAIKSTVYPPRFFIDFANNERFISVQYFWKVYHVSGMGNNTKTTKQSHCSPSESLWGSGETGM